MCFGRLGTVLSYLGTELHLVCLVIFGPGKSNLNKYVFRHIWTTHTIVKEQMLYDNYFFVELDRQSKVMFL